MYFHVCRVSILGKTITSLKLFTLHCFNPGRMPIWSISKQHWRCRCCRCCKWVKGESNESTMKSLFEPNIQLLSHSLWVSDFSLDHFRTFLLFLQRSETLCKVSEALQEAEVQLRNQGQADGARQRYIACEMIRSPNSSRVLKNNRFTMVVHRLSNDMYV